MACDIPNLYIPGYKPVQYAVTDRDTMQVSNRVYLNRNDTVKELPDVVTFSWL